MYTSVVSSDISMIHFFSREGMKRDVFDAGRKDTKKTSRSWPWTTSPRPKIQSLCASGNALLLLPSKENCRFAVVLLSFTSFTSFFSSHYQCLIEDAGAKNNSFTMKILVKSEPQCNSVLILASYLVFLNAFFVIQAGLSMILMWHLRISHPQYVLRWIFNASDIFLTSISKGEIARLKNSKTCADCSNFE